MSWDDRKYDISDIVNSLSDWVRADADGDSESLFYFTHIFDAHSPYVPPSWLLTRSDLPLDFTVPDAFLNLNNNNYLTTLRSDGPEFPDDDLQLIEDYYRLSLEYVATKLAEFVSTLKDVGLYDQSLLIFIGDHGEDFLERNFTGHNSLTDHNIRPGTIVKPPADADFSVPDEMDNIDIFPTICELLDIPVPEQCQGKSWQSHQSRPRITERIADDSYNISVEDDGYKAIFSFDDEFPTRPRTEVIERGPNHTETYDMEQMRDGDHSRHHSIPDDVEQRLLEIANRFVAEYGPGSTDMETVSVEDDVKERLEQLGYK
jgi:arylsulfatase A-like enzyme